MAFKPNRDLLNVNFEGYKLSTSPVTCLKQDIKGTVQVAKLKDGDFSFQHMKAFSLHNHLTCDPFDDESVYWYSQDGSLWKGTYVTSTDELTMHVVYTIPPPGEACNATLVFLSTELCLFSHGTKNVILLHTGKRSENSKWEKIQTFALSERYPLMIAAATVTPGDNSSVQILCAQLLDPSVSNQDPPTSTGVEGVKSPVVKYVWYCLKFMSSIDTIELPVASFRNAIEGIFHILSFQSQSLALYAAFQSHPTNKSTYLLFMSETTPNLPSLKVSGSGDSATPTDPKDEDEPSEGIAKHSGLGYESQGYSWSQSDSDVVIKFELPKGVTKKEVDCVISTKELVVGLTDGTTFFRGELNDSIDTEASTWTIEKETLEVTLEKKQSGVHWPYLHRDGKEGGNHHVLLSEGREGDLTKEELEKVMAEDQENADNFDKPPEAKKRRPLVTNELEDCDTNNEDSTMFVIAQDGSLVQKAPLSGRNLVFTSPSLPGHALHFALRHDVDAVVWLPSSICNESPNEPSWSHVDTFNALGYVQASKENRKFTTCPANLKFSVISDCTRHIFVYLQSANGFRDNSALEFVHTLDEKVDILGLTASNDGLVFVLTSTMLFVIKIPL